MLPRLLIGKKLVGHLFGTRGIEELSRLHQMIKHCEVLLVETGVARTTVVGKGEYPAQVLRRKVPDSIDMAPCLRCLIQQGIGSCQVVGSTLVVERQVVGWQFAITPLQHLQGFFLVGMRQLQGELCEGATHAPTHARSSAIEVEAWATETAIAEAVHEVVIGATGVDAYLVRLMAEGTMLISEFSAPVKVPDRERKSVIVP